MGCSVSTLSEETIRLSNQGFSEVRGKNRLVSQAGYTKSIDMWSLGCLTAALLIGTSVFVNPQDLAYRQNSTAAIITAAAECDLTKLDTEPLWKDVSRQAKDFVKRVVRLEENERLTAEQALQHSWFCEGDRKVLFQARYKKAIERWKPHRPGLDFIEDLDVLIQGRRLSAEFCAMGKRRRSSSVDQDEVEIYAEVGLENRGFISAKAFGDNVARKRLQREQQR
jgi:serine/threonine protein kinase